jgi:hypothetical protein
MTRTAGMAPRARAGHRMDGHGAAGSAGLGFAPRVQARQGSAGMASTDETWLDPTRRRRHREASRGKAGAAWLDGRGMAAQASPDKT